MLSQFQIDGSAAIITGASGGIGKAIAQRYVDDGVDVGICSRDIDRIEGAADDITADSPDGNVYAAECDVRDRERVFDFVQECIDEFGEIDILVNNAAGDFRAPFEEISENGWNTIFDINVNGTVHFSHAVGEYMREQEQGNIINIISVAGLQGGSPGSSHYGASKAAIKNLTESLATEWSEYNIRVNNIAPGLIATPGVASQLGIEVDELPPRSSVDRGIGGPEEIADIAQFLASPASSYISGETIVASLPGQLGDD